MDFETLWNSIDNGDMRGWYSAPIDNVVRRMQQSGSLRLRVIAADFAPFPGADFGILV